MKLISVQIVNVLNAEEYTLQNIAKYRERNVFIETSVLNAGRIDGVIIEEINTGKTGKKIKKQDTGIIRVVNVTGRMWE